MLKACAYNIRKAPIRDLLISIHKTRDFEWQTAHTKGCQENRCEFVTFFYNSDLEAQAKIDGITLIHPGLHEDSQPTVFVHNRKP